VNVTQQFQKFRVFTFDIRSGRRNSAPALVVCLLVTGRHNIKQAKPDALKRLDGKSTVRTFRAMGDKCVLGAVKEALSTFGAHDERRSHVSNTQKDNRYHREQEKERVNKHCS